MISEETKKQLLAELEKYGNIYASCLKIGIHRSTLYRWMEKNKRFKKEVEKAVDIGRSNICDMAENALLQNMKNGNQRAAEYVLSHNSDRYKRKETSNVVIVHKKDFTPEVRKPSMQEILDVYDRIFCENPEEEKDEEIKRRAREEKLKEERENMERIPPDYELEQQGAFTQKQEEIKIETPIEEKAVESEKIETEIPRRPRPRNKEDRNYPSF